MHCNDVKVMGSNPGRAVLGFAVFFCLSRACSKNSNNKRQVRMNIVSIIIYHITVSSKLCTCIVIITSLSGLYKQELQNCRKKLHADG